MTDIVKKGMNKIMNENEIFILLQTELKKFKYDKTNLTKSNTSDGRGESNESEHDFCVALKTFLEKNTAFKADIAPPRYWYDIVIYYENFFLPANVKLTEERGADNISSKFGLLYTLTGIRPEDMSGLNYWDKYNKTLTYYYDPDLHTDYYLIVYNKITEDITLSSLKRVEKLVSNGANLPFQCDWSKKENKIVTKRSQREQCAYLMNTFIESWKKRINLNAFAPLVEWEELYNEQ